MGLFLWNRSLLAASSVFMRNILSEEDSFVILDSFSVKIVKSCFYTLAGKEATPRPGEEDKNDESLLEILSLEDLSISKNLICKLEVNENDPMKEELMSDNSDNEIYTGDIYDLDSDQDNDPNLEKKKMRNKKQKSKNLELKSPKSKESINSNCFIKEPSPDRYVNGIKSDVYFLSPDTAITGPPYTCITCDYGSESKRNVKLHYNRKHNKEEKLYKCRNCEKKFYHSSEVVSHWKRMHGDSNEYMKCVCDICGKMFFLPSQLKEHELLHSGKEYPCKFCGKIFKTPKYLKGHESLHTAEIVACKICGKTFTTQKGAIEHEQRIHSNTVVCIPCDLCGKLLNSKDNLKLHIQRLHTNVDKRYSCELCPLSFHIPSQLKKHVETVHEKSTLFSCPFCGQVLSSKDKFKRHSQRKHGGMELPVHIRTLCPPNALEKVQTE